RGAWFGLRAWQDASLGGRPARPACGSTCPAGGPGRKCAGDAADALGQRVLARGEGEADEAVVAERGAGHERDAGILDQLATELDGAVDAVAEEAVDAEEEVERAVGVDELGAGQQLAEERDDVVAPAVER